MGKEHPTLDNNRYCSMFLIKKSRYAMIFLHEDKSAATNKAMILKAIAYTQCQPTILRSDSAKEYIALDRWFNRIGIWQQISNPDEQEQNGAVEKLRD